MINTFFIKTFGCKVNQFESEYFLNKLVNFGYIPVQTPEKADVVIINSCAVTKEAERQFLQFVRRIKREFPGKKLVLTGCSIDNNFEKIKNLNIAEIVISNFYKKDIPDIINKDSLLKLKSIFMEKNFNFLQSSEKAFHTRKFYKIQDGCNNYCSYCVIPFLRGNPRSLEIEQVKNEILKLSKKFKEIVLTGINIGIYGIDLNIKNGLFQLLTTLENELDKRNVSDFRMRLTSLKPDEVKDDLIDFIKRSKYFTPHFHLSVQNFNDKVLKLMKRRYNFQTIKERVEKIKGEIPFAGIGADIITGFPGETDSIFQENLEKMEIIDINFFHIFPFSKREKTEAYNFKETASKKEKKDRVNKLKLIAAIKKEEFLKKNLTNKFKVLIETVEGEYLTGYSENYIKIYIPFKGNFKLKNNFLNVKGEKIYNKEIIVGRVV